MQNESDLIESLDPHRRAGARIRQKKAIGSCLRLRLPRFARRLRVAANASGLLWAGAAAVMVFAIASMFQWTPPSAERGELARVVRVIGIAEQATRDVWQPLGETRTPLTMGVKLRTRAGGTSHSRCPTADPFASTRRLK